MEIATARAGKRLAAALALALACAVGMPAAAQEAQAAELAPAAASAAAHPAKAQAKKAKKAKISVKAEKKVKYTGKAVKPSLSVKSRGKALVEKKDYKVAYLDKSKKKVSAKKVKKPGTYYAKVTGKGKYKGAKKTVKFKVWSKDGKKWVPAHEEEEWVSKLEPEQGTYYWGYDITVQKVVPVLEDETLVTFEDSDYTRLYFTPEGQTEVLTHLGTYGGRGYYIDGKAYMDMPEVLQDFFTSFYSDNYSGYRSAKWGQLLVWLDVNDWDAEATARTIRFFDSKRLGPVHLDEDGEWAAAEVENCRVYADALEPLVPGLKAAAEGVYEGAHGGDCISARGGWVLTNYGVKYYQSPSAPLVDNGRFEMVTVEGHWE